jgi:membrane protease YdiL (CAAX protease family)
MINKLEQKRILIFLAFAFGIAWAGSLVIYLTGGLFNSPKIVGPLTLAILILAIVYMGAPAVAHIMTRLVTREGWKDLTLRPNLRRGWPYWLACWFGPGLMVAFGMVVFFILFPVYYDPELGTVMKLLESASSQPGQTVTAINPWIVVFGQTAQAFILAPLLNALPIFGEEFGWRAYLQPKLMSIGGRKAMLLMGIIWGVWHWPVIAMGHNYGLDYPGAPWLGLLAMIWFTFLFGTILGWAVLKAGSVWPAVIGHGALNGMAGIAGFFIIGKPNLLLGPSVVGIIGSLGLGLVALLLYALPQALKAPEQRSRKE